MERQSYKLPVQQNLTIDIARIGARDAEGVLFVTSGLHGAELYAGAAIIHDAMTNKTAYPDDIAVVFVHALNPFGAVYMRRVNEHHVDLDRNFIDWKKGIPEDHAMAAQINDILLPDELPAPSFGAHLFAQLPNIDFHEIQNALTCGQHTMPNGMFYGGGRAEWSNLVWQSILDAHVRNARHVAFLDIHTGLGKRGLPQIILPVSLESDEGRRAQAWWGKDIVRSMADGNSVSSPVTGDIACSFNDAAQTGVICTRATMEFGTVSHPLVLEALAFDNWVHAKQPGDFRLVEEAQKRMKNAFAPEDEDWRSAVLVHGRCALGKAVRGLTDSLKAEL